MVSFHAIFFSFHISLFILRFERISLHRLSLINRILFGHFIRITAIFLIKCFMAMVNVLFGKFCVIFCFIASTIINYLNNYFCVAGESAKIGSKRFSSRIIRSEEQREKKKVEWFCFESNAGTLACLVLCCNHWAFYWDPCCESATERLFPELNSNHVCDSLPFKYRKKKCCCLVDSIDSIMVNGRQHPILDVEFISI